MQSKGNTLSYQTLRLAELDHAGIVFSLLILTPILRHFGVLLFVGNPRFFCVSTIIYGDECLTKCVAYKIECRHCKEFYIGNTTMAFKARVRNQCL